MNGIWQKLVICAMALALWGTLFIAPETGFQKIFDFLSGNQEAFANPAPPANRPSLETLIDNIQEAYNQANDMSAEFTQEAFNQAVGRSQKAKGKVYVKKPNLMRWDYQEPDLQHFIVDGKTFWWYTPQSNQVIKQPATGAFDSKIPLSFLGGVGNIRQDFHISYAKEGVARKGFLALALSPKKPTGNLKQLIMEVEPETFVIRRVVMKDAFGNRTTIFLYNMRVNRNISPERFNFTPPPGVQVITPEDFPGGF